MSWEGLTLEDCRAMDIARIPKLKSELRRWCMDNRENFLQTGSSSLGLKGARDIDFMTALKASLKGEIKLI